jgi:hypothetical protein
MRLLILRFAMVLGFADFNLVNIPVTLWREWCSTPVKFRGDLRADPPALRLGWRTPSRE